MYFYTNLRFLTAIFLANSHIYYKQTEKADKNRTLDLFVCRDYVILHINKNTKSFALPRRLDSALVLVCATGALRWLRCTDTVAEPPQAFHTNAIYE